MKYVLASAALVFASVSASAADMGTPATYDWSGFYLGGQAGYSWNHVSGPFDDAAQTVSGPYSFDMNGGLVGAYAGYNFQYDALVIGLEGDANFAFGNKTTDHNVMQSATAYDITGEQTWNGDVRARFGYAIDRFLPYVTGGVAFGDVKTSYALAGSSSFLSHTSGRVGWTLGGGVEYAFTDNLIGRVEYRYTDLGTASFTDTGTNTYDNPKFHSNSLLVGVSYKF
jgi:outer membrane immunogenic protein